MKNIFRMILGFVLFPVFIVVFIPYMLVVICIEGIGDYIHLVKTGEKNERKAERTKV